VLIGWAANAAAETGVEFDNGTLLFYDTSCDNPYECTFATVGCESKTPSISFSMDQRDISEWFTKSNGRVQLKAGKVSIEAIPNEIGHADMDDSWWPSLIPANDRDTAWAVMTPGRILEIIAGPKHLKLTIPKQIEDVRSNCKE
jgi:hypothetical protein